MSAQTVNPNKALWEKGDFTRIAETMRASGDALVEQLGVTAGMKVLDLGCGDGTTAIPEAERGADVLGVDLTAKLLAAGRARAEAAGLANIRFQEGDASHLDDLEDDTFDLVVSIFGAMFAPKPFDVAKEMVRVAKPGGRVVMGNWIPGDPTLVAQVLRVGAAYSPPPPDGFISPVTWGVEKDVLERFERAGVARDQVTCTRESFTFTHPGPPSEFLALFRDYYGPTMNAYAAAGAAGRADQLHAELEELFDEHNAATDGSTLISAGYLLVQAEVR